MVGVVDEQPATEPGAGNVPREAGGQIIGACDILCTLVGVLLGSGALTHDVIVAAGELARAVADRVLPARDIRTADDSDQPAQRPDARR